jgi:hypothetical protein
MLELSAKAVSTMTGTEGFASRKIRSLPKKVSTYRVCDPVQCAEEITRRGREWRVNLNPATLVTPTVQCPILIYLMTKKPARIVNNAQDPKAVKKPTLS